MRGLHLVAILLVLVREHATAVPICPGEFNVTDVALPQDRPVTVGFVPNPSIQENVTYAWTIYVRKEGKWLKKEECLEQYNMTMEEHGSTLRISWIPMEIVVRIIVFRDGEKQCYKDTRLFIPVCPGEFNVTDVALPQDRPVTVGFLPNPSIQENVTYAWTIYVRKEGKWLKKEECLEQYNMTMEEHGSTLRISWIPMEIVVRMIVFRDGEKQCFKNTRLFVLEKPSEPILGQLRGSGLDGCDRCLFLPHNEQHPTIFCDVKGGAPPLNVTMFIDTRAYTPNITSRDGYTRNKHYKLTVDRAELQHRSDVRCEVMSPALVEPLIATAQVYIEVPPQNVILTLNDVTIGQTGTVRCESKGMRPAVNITDHLDGRQCVSNRTVIHENRTDTYDVTTTLECLGTKSLYRKRIKCCIRSEQICSPEKYLNVLFPPDTASANQSVLVSGQSNVTVRCSVSEANPSCDINWRVPDRIQRLTTERQLDNTAGDLDGRYAQISELSLQRNPEHNGQQIACTVKCGNFDVIEETVTLIIPGPPLITITPGIRITRTEGDALQLNCTVNSHLSTKTQWSFYGNKSCNNIPCNEVGKSFEDRSVECGAYSRCLDFESLARSDTGFYACFVETREFGSTKQHVALEVFSPELQSDTACDTSHLVVAAVVASTIAFFATVSTILLAIYIVRRKTAMMENTYDQAEIKANVTNQREEVMLDVRVNYETGNTVDTGNGDYYNIDREPYEDLRHDQSTAHVYEDADTRLPF